TAAHNKTADRQIATLHKLLQNGYFFTVDSQRFQRMRTVSFQIGCMTMAAAITATVMQVILLILVVYSGFICIIIHMFSPIHSTIIFSTICLFLRKAKTPE
ncbi:MAG: hypothetical protein WAX04_02680, partial [Oscillospiraceae bacterium]